MNYRNIFLFMTALFFGLSGCAYKTPDMPKRPLDKNPVNRVIPYVNVVTYIFEEATDRIYGSVYSYYFDMVNSNYVHTLDAITIYPDGNYSKTTINSFSSAVISPQFTGIKCCVSPSNDAYILYTRTSVTQINIWSFTANSGFSVFAGPSPETLEAVHCTADGKILCGFLESGAAVFRIVDTDSKTCITQTTASLFADEILEIGFRDSNNIYAFINNNSTEIYEYYIPLDASAVSGTLLAVNSTNIIQFQPIYVNGEISEILFCSLYDTFLHSAKKVSDLWYVTPLSIDMAYRDSGFGAFRDSSDGLAVVFLQFDAGIWEYEVRQFMNINSISPFYSQRVFTHFNVAYTSLVYFLPSPDSSYAFIALRPGVMNGINGLIYQMYKEL